MIQANSDTETGFKETEIGFIPADWDVIFLEDVFKLSSGKSRPQNTANTQSSDKIYPVYGGNGIMGFTDSFLVDSRRIILGRVGEYCGSVYICEDKSWISDNALYVREMLTTQIRQEYLFHVLGWRNLNQFKKKSGQPLITQSIVYSVSIPLPPLPEQRRIAAVLNTIQDEIAAQDDIIAEARAFKRSLMQRLFTYGPGEHPAETKMTEIGEIPAHWELVELGSHANISTGTTPSTKRPEYYIGKNAFIKTAEIINNRISATANLVSDQAVRDYNLKIYPPGTLLMAMYGQGKTRGQISLLELPASTTQNAAAIVPDESVNPVYLWQYLLSQYERLRRSGIEGHISHLNLSYVKTLRIPIPSTNEQQEISEALTDIDQKIAVEEDRKAAMQDFFKSMLHQLMTGQIRFVGDD